MVTTAPSADDITIANNVSIADTVTVENVAAKAVVKVYDSADATTVIGTATAEGTAVVSLKAGFTTDKVFVSVTNTNKKESTRVEKAVAAEEKSTILLESNVTTTNNVVTTDEVTVNGLVAKDLVTVYAADGTTVIGSVTASSEGTLVVAIKNGLTAGKIYVTITNYNKLQSDALEVIAKEEEQTQLPESE